MTSTSIPNTELLLSTTLLRISKSTIRPQSTPGGGQQLEAFLAEFYARKQLTYYLVGIGGMVACAFGLLGNAASFVVITHKSVRRSSTYAYLAALAICDALFIVSTIFLLVKDAKAPSLKNLTWPWGDGIFPYVFPFAHPTAFTLHVISIWLTVAFTVDRYIMICHPFRGKQYCTRRRAVYVIIALYATGFLLHVPKYYEYETVRIPFFNGTTRVGCDLTSFGQSYAFRQVFHSGFYLVFVCALPFLVMAVLNGFLIAAVKSSARVGREMWAAKDKRTDTTVMLIGVVIIFFVCQTPALVSRIAWATQDNVKESNRFYAYAINEVGTFLVILNACINIVPYFFFGRRFRTLFFHMFCRCVFGRFFGEGTEYSDLRPQHRFSLVSSRQGSVTATATHLTTHLGSGCHRSSSQMSTSRSPVTPASIQPLFCVEGGAEELK